MNLSDLCRKLSYGELSNLSMANDADGTIAAAARPRIVAYANEGLLELHSRFLLREKELVLRTYEDTKLYRLLPRFALNYTPEGEEDDEPVRYIQDTAAEPYIGDLIKVLSVHECGGCRLPLNDDGLCNSVFTPLPNTLQVPCPEDDEYLSLMYQAKHPEIADDLGEEIDIPDVLLGALTAFVAYKVFSHMNTQESTAKAQEHLAIYEAKCQGAEGMDLVSTSISTTNPRFCRGGWV